MEPDPCASVLGTAELCAYIVDFMHGSVKDLKYCALVSSTFTSSAQSHLFYELNLGGPNPTFSSPNQDDCKRLRECLEAYPHLSSFVRRITVRLDANLAYLVGLPLSRLDFLFLFEDTGWYVQAGASLAAQSLLSLPSLRTLVVRASFPDPAMLNVLFAHCTPTIRTLDLRYVTVDDVASSSQAPVSAAKIQIKELRLAHTGGIAEWFAAPQCPVDLGHLRHLDTHMSTSPGMALLLQRASTTIEELRVHTYDLAYGLSLHSFLAPSPRSRSYILSAPRQPRSLPHSFPPPVHPSS
ncbi:hypothetical protein C8R46DRAFT_1345337 [Mycena filopes]|nr:hypothetical protein C8R46DRAFT_1345337 [Mycena filopes]